jgi:type IV secretory pathway TrbD component
MSLLGLPSLVVGIILWTAGASHHWFSGAGTVGEILTLVSAAWILITLCIFGLIIWANMEPAHSTYKKPAKRKK